MNREQKQLIFDAIGYNPNPSQEPIHASDARTILVAGGERGGKSRVSSAELIARLIGGSLFWLVGESYEQTKAEFDYICEGLDKMSIKFKATKRVDPGEIIGASLPFTILTKSARDPRKLGMQAPDGILACEAAQLDYETFLRLLGRAAEKRGWIILSGTFESSLGWYPELWARWLAPNDEEAQSFSIPTWSNLAIFPGGEDDPEILKLKAACSEEWYLERYGGVPTPPAGRVFNEFSYKIHTGVGGDYDFNPAEPCYLWIDPGYATAYAIEIVQKRGDHIYIIDEIFERGLVTSEMIVVCKQKPWWNKVIGGAVDVAATQHQAQPAVVETWRKEAGVPLRHQKIRVMDGIERVKGFLKVNPITNRPLLHINARCKGVISEMGGCPNPITNQTAVWKWRKDREGTIVGTEPEDKNNHSCKAVAYGLVSLVGYADGLNTKTQVKFI